jgi:hypothetical protein
MFQTKVVGKMKTYLMFSNRLFENRAGYAAVWKHVAEPDRPRDNVIRRSESAICMPDN